jgi:2-oxoglutarate dehydrogenase E2 component (dihydrolipoamide succinyltransferase)
MATKVVMPEMGEGVVDATIIQWLKNEGDTVEQYEPLVEVNTDKVDTEVPSPVSGTVLKILQSADAVVEVNALLAWIGEPGEELPAGGTQAAPAAKTEAPKKEAPPKAKEPAPEPEPAAPPARTPAPAARVQPAPSPNGGAIGFISPLVARVAAEHSVDLTRVPGSGDGGRITKDDVLAFVQSGGAARTPATPVAAPPVRSGARASFISPVVARLAGEHNIDLSRVPGTGLEGRITKKDVERVIAAGGLPPAPSLVPATAPSIPAPPPQVFAGSDAVPGEIIRMTPVRRAIAKHMVESKHTSPHVTTIMEADLNRVVAHRAANKEVFARDGAKLTFTAYFIAAIVAALKAYPIVNSSCTDEGIQVHAGINVGMATAYEGGLIVPVIKQADGLSLVGLARAINDLADRARAKQLKPDEVRGGTFTITNHGTNGSLFATPVINQPQCGILGVGMLQKRAVVINDAIAIRPMVYLGFTFDHRMLDGAVADYFLGHIKTTLENWN